MKKGFLIFLSFLSLAKISFASDPKDYSDLLEEDLSQYSQDCTTYIKNINSEKFKIKPRLDKLNKKYKQKYFQTWTKRYYRDELDKIIKTQKMIIDYYIENPGYDINGKKFTLDFVQKITRNIEFDNFPNIKRKGIVLNNTYIRALPTLEPVHTKNFSCKKSCPFDKFQISLICLGQPIYLLHQSVDKQWTLIIDSFKNIGWVKSIDITLIEQETIDHLMDSIYVVSINDDETIVDKINNQFLSKTRLGNIYPVIKADNKDYYILYPVKKDMYCILKTAKISKLAITKFPMKFTFENIAYVANKLINTKYGWGDIHMLRDCSSSLKDILSVFGIFLPRMSINQKEEGTKIDISNLSIKAKLLKIKEVGIPYLSLLFMPGHIFLYLGIYKDKIMVYHNYWGIISFKEKNLSGVLGKTIIMPIEMVNKEKYKIEKTFIERITSITNLEKDILI